MKLYRPVGLKEYIKIKDSGFKNFPPRFSYQPIFYPVLNKEYACQIAKDWNTRDKVSDYVGIVLVFDVNNGYITKFEPQVVGNKKHKELWIPAEDLEEFNNNIIGDIEVVEVFYGEKYCEKLI
jgi:hypothetical protein